MLGKLNDKVLRIAVALESIAQSLSEMRVEQKTALVKMENQKGNEPEQMANTIGEVMKFFKPIKTKGGKENELCKRAG